MASFCSDLLAIMDRSIILKSVCIIFYNLLFIIIYIIIIYFFLKIEKFIHNVTSDEPGSALNDFKFEFLRILIEYEHLVSLNLPLKFSDTLPTSAETVNFFKGRHYLATLIVEDIRQYLEKDDKSIRIKAMDIARRLFISQSYDKTLYSKTRRIRGATVYFPLLGVVCIFKSYEKNIIFYINYF